MPTRGTTTDNEDIATLLCGERKLACYPDAILASQPPKIEKSVLSYGEFRISRRLPVSGFAYARIVQLVQVLAAKEETVLFPCEIFLMKAHVTLWAGKITEKVGLSHDRSLFRGWSPCL
ncbi:MAG: hypothetical protein P8I27_16510 [Pirellulaceae bacterium]|nr:hypothetical protein [Pirellulaceae bacterium]